MREYDQETLKKVQRAELSILKDFIELCNRHGLIYFGIAGTGIGALRHKGFIPWDDDIDVAMPREDFDRFCLIVKEEMADKYLLMNTEENENYPLMTSRLMLRGTEFREEALKDIDCPLGIFLDLYPLDKVSDDPGECKKQFRDAWFWSKMLILRSIPHPVLGFGGVKAKAVQWICGAVHGVMAACHISKRWLYHKCLEACTRFRHYEKTTRIDFLCDTTPYMNIHETEGMFPLQKLEFEDILVDFPGNIHSNLVREYGDYMQLPPEEKRKNHYPYMLDFGSYDF